MTEKELQELIVKFVELEHSRKLQSKKLLIEKALQIDFYTWMKKDYPSHALQTEMQAKQIKMFLYYLKQKNTLPAMATYTKSEFRTIQSALISGYYLRQENGIQYHLAMSALASTFYNVIITMLDTAICVIQGSMSDKEFMQYYNNFMETNDER